MGATMTTIEIEQRTAETLKAKAEASDLSLDDYLRLLAESDVISAVISTLLDNARAAMAMDKSPPIASLNAIEIERVLDELAQGGEDLSPLPVNFSREDIYFDHD
jgi:hypothetical protein